MALPHRAAVCKIYQRLDDPKITVCKYPSEPLPEGHAWRYIGSRRVDDWSQSKSWRIRAGFRLDELPRSGAQTATPDVISRMQRPDKRKAPRFKSQLQKQLYDIKNRSTLKPGELPPLPQRAGDPPRARLLSPTQRMRVQGPLTFWGTDANPVP